jgi:hypothetical protein
MCPRYGHVFSVGGGGGTDLRLGGLNPPTPKNFACGEQKKVAGFSEKFFTTWKKLPHPPSQFWPEVWRFFGGIYPHTPTPMSGTDQVTHALTEQSNGQLLGAAPVQTREKDKEKVSQALRGSSRTAQVFAQDQTVAQSPQSERNVSSTNLKSCEK